VRSPSLVTLAFLAAACPSAIEPPPLTETAATFKGYDSHIKPLLDARCVVCHSCYNAPCQLNLASYEGLERGGNEKVIYAPTRVEGHRSDAHVHRRTDDARVVRAVQLLPRHRAHRFRPRRNLSESILYQLVQQRELKHAAAEARRGLEPCVPAYAGGGR